MTRLPRIVTLLGSALLLAACGQLIGLGDYESVDGEGGEAGEKTGGRGGNGGSGGNAGTATAGTGGQGGTGGSAGGTAGKGGTAGDVGTAGSGGSTGGTGTNEGGAGGDSAGSGGEAGEAGAPGCREVTSIDYEKMTLDTEDPEFLIAEYLFAFLPNLGSTLGDQISMQFYESPDESLDGAATGTFALGTDIDANFETCARCLRLYQDAGSAALGKIFFATSGTLTVEPSSLQMAGSPYFSLRDVTLVEVTIDDDDVSTPVPNGECVHFDALDLNREPPPSEWTCSPDYYWDGQCDCGCGTLDPACATSYVSACEYCGNTNSCSTDGDYCSDIKIDENWTCVSPQPWTCLASDYGDGFCDCGCGVADVDCVDSSFEECIACHCDDPAVITCVGATVDPADTTLCLP